MTNIGASPAAFNWSYAGCSVGLPKVGMKINTQRPFYQFGWGLLYECGFAGTACPHLPDEREGYIEHSSYLCVLELFLQKP